MTTTDEPRPMIGTAAVLLAGGGALLTWIVIRRASAAPRNAAGPALHLGSLAAGQAVTIFDEVASMSVLRNAKRAHRATSAKDVELAAFAKTVIDLAEAIDANPTAAGLARGRFGRKVFLSAVRRALKRTDYGRLSRSDIDQLLVDANRDGLLSLARGDLVAVMDPDEVAESEIRSLGSTFHFVVADRRNGAGAGTAGNPFRGCYQTRPGEGGEPVRVTWELWWAGRDWRVDVEVNGQPWAEHATPDEVRKMLAGRIPRAAAAAIGQQIAKQVPSSQRVIDV